MGMNVVGSGRDIQDATEKRVIVKQLIQTLYLRKYSV
jgi:hypothetical protein